MKTISVIIPIYNVENYLYRCLNSIIQTDGRVVEILCINDGSTDKSKCVIQELMGKDNRIKLIDQNNQGLCAARNTGIDIVSGQYIMFVDGDDYIFPTEFHAMLDEFDLYSDIDGVWTGYIRDDWKGLYKIDTNLSIGLYSREQIGKQYFSSILGISYEKMYAWFRGKQLLSEKQELPTVWRGLYSKRLLDKYNIRFDNNLLSGEDMIFNWKYYSVADNILVCNHNYYCYVWREGSVTQNSELNFYEGRKRLLKARSEVNEELMHNGLKDMSGEYQATLVMTKIQMAFILSKCSIIQFLQRFYLFKDYSNETIIVQAYKLLKIKDAPIKIKAVLLLSKYRADFLLFFVGWILNKLSIHIYPDEQ